MVGRGRLGYVPALDGIRAIAIVLVVSRHFWGRPLGGGYGVDVFFVLSGFLITTLLLEEHARDGAIALRAFYMRRARRLLPALFTMLGLATLILSLAVSPTKLLETIGPPALYASNFVRAYVKPDWMAGSPADHLWSLAEEEQFYLVWPVALIFMLRRRVQLVRVLEILVAALVAYRFAWIALGANPGRIHYSPDTHAEGLMLGCLLAALRGRGFLPPAWLGWVGLAAIAVIAKVQMPHLWVYGLPIVELASALVIAAAVQPGLVQRALSVRPLVYIGVISYSIYVWHQFVHWLFLWGHPNWSAAVTVLFAVGSYHLVEKRFRHARPAPLRSSPMPVPAPLGS